MAIDRSEALVRARWPEQPFDPARARVSYSDLADELVIYFGERPVASYVDFIDAPGLADAAILIGEDARGEDTGEVVGGQVDFLEGRASKIRPTWASLAAPSPPPEAIAALVAGGRGRAV